MSSSKNSFFYLSVILTSLCLTLSLPNFLNGLFWNCMAIIILRDIKITTWSANTIEPGKTTQVYRLAMLYTGGNHFWLPQDKGLTSFKMQTHQISITTGLDTNNGPLAQGYLFSLRTPMFPS